MKRVFAFITALALLFTMSVQAFGAKEKYTYEVIQDANGIRVATEYIDGVKYVYTFDEQDYELTTQTFDATGTMTSVKTHTLRELAGGLPPCAIVVKPCEETHRQYTFLNYSYEQIGILDYKFTNRKTTVYRSFPLDSLAIQNYVQAVDALKAAEDAVAYAGGLDAVWAIDTYGSIGLTAGELTTALGISYTDVVAFIQAVDNCNSVWTQYIEA